jgi:uncharacterized lipoprotein
MRTTQLTAVVAASVLVLGLTACSSAASTEPVESTAPEVVEETTEEPGVVWTEEELTADLIEDFPADQTAALTALSERLDAAAPSAVAVAVRVSIFEEGKVIARIWVKDDEAVLPAAELTAILRELAAFTGSPVTEWLVDAKTLEDFSFELDAVAAEAGLPADFDGGWGDLEFSPEQLAAFLG